MAAIDIKLSTNNEEETVLDPEQEMACDQETLTSSVDIISPGCSINHIT